MSAIIYTTNTGSTEHYAKLLAQKTGLPVYSLCYVRAHPISWNVPTQILYGEHDNLTSMETVSAFAKRYHAETDYLLTYPEENSFTVQEKAKFLKARSESKNAIEIAAFVDGRIVGTAGIDPIGDKEKIRHRADFGIAIEKAYWGHGVGRALTLACIECAKQAGYLQIELEVVAENASAVRLYESVGFQEYGRNSRGFRARSGWQTLVLMRLELDS